MISIGIDPGISGAVAAVCENNALVWDLPVEVRRVGNRINKRIDPAGLQPIARSIFETSYQDIWVFLESVHATPQMGVCSSFNFGDSYGICRCFSSMFGGEVVEVTPATWKKHFGLIRNGSRLIGALHREHKREGLELARKLFPELSKSLALAKHDGRADALLIARYGLKLLQERRVG